MHLHHVRSLRSGTIYISVHWYCQTIAQKYSYLVKYIEKLHQNYIFLNYIFTSQFLRPYERRYTLRAHRLQYVHTCPLGLSQIYHGKKLYGNKWVNYEFWPKFHFLHYIFHISPGPYKRRYTLRSYTLQHVYSCPLVWSQIYNRENLYSNKWVNYEFSPKISLFTLYFSHFTGTI